MVEGSFRIKTFSNNSLDDAKRKIQEAKRLKREEEDLKRRGGIFGSGSDSGSNRRGTLPGRQSQNTTLPPRTDTTSRSAFTTTEFNKVKAQQRAAQKKIDEITKKQKQFQDKFIDKLDFAEGLSSDLTNLPGLSSRILGRAGPIGAIIASALAPIIALFTQELERGGLLSTKLKVTKNAVTVNDIDELTNARSGTKFLTSDLTITQGSPNNSNTQNLKYEHIRYVMEDVGRGT